MKRLGSNFVTPIGLAILAALILLAAYLNISALTALLTGVFLLCLAAFLWSRFALEHIEVDIEDEDCRAFPGEMLQAKAKLRNGKLLPLIWLEASFPTGERACVGQPPEEYETEQADEADQAEEEGKAPNTVKPSTDIKETFLWVMPHQSISWTQEVLALRRGVCRIENMELSSGDGFGLANRGCTAALTTPFRFIVYPQIIPVDVSPILSHMSELEKYDRGFYTDNTLISSIRDYREGDSFRDVNWRLLAKQDSVQVNVHEKLAMRRVCLMPDLESFVYTTVVESPDGERSVQRVVREENMEHMLSILASVIMGVHERGVLCSLVIPAIGDAPAKLVMPLVQEMQVMELLTALAELEYHGEETSIPADELLDNIHNLGQLFVFSRQLPEEDTLEQTLDGVPVIRVVQSAGEQGLARQQIIEETDLVSA